MLDKLTEVNSGVTVSRSFNEKIKFNKTNDMSEFELMVKERKNGIKSGKDMAIGFIKQVAISEKQGLYNVMPIVEKSGMGLGAMVHFRDKVIEVYEGIMKLPV